MVSYGTTISGGACSSRFGVTSINPIDITNFQKCVIVGYYTKNTDGIAGFGFEDTQLSDTNYLPKGTSVASGYIELPLSSYDTKILDISNLTGKKYLNMIYFGGTESKTTYMYIKEIYLE
jgi:hypothetical protein